MARRGAATDCREAKDLQSLFDKIPYIDKFVYNMSSPEKKLCIRNVGKLVSGNRIVCDGGCEHMDNERWAALARQLAYYDRRVSGFASAHSQRCSAAYKKIKHLPGHRWEPCYESVALYLYFIGGCFEKGAALTMEELRTGKAEPREPTVVQQPRRLLQRPAPWAGACPGKSASAAEGADFPRLCQAENEASEAAGTAKAARSQEAAELAKCKEVMRAAVEKAASAEACAEEAEKRAAAALLQVAPAQAKCRELEGRLQEALAAKAKLQTQLGEALEANETLQGARAAQDEAAQEWQGEEELADPVQQTLMAPVGAVAVPMQYFVAMPQLPCSETLSESSCYFAVAQPQVYSGDMADAPQPRRAESACSGFSSICPPTTAASDCNMTANLVHLHSMLQTALRLLTGETLPTKDERLRCTVSLKLIMEAFQMHAPDQLADAAQQLGAFTPKS